MEDAFPSQSHHSKSSGADVSQLQVSSQVDEHIQVVEAVGVYIETHDDQVGEAARKTFQGEDEICSAGLEGFLLEGRGEPFDGSEASPCCELSSC